MWRDFMTALLRRLSPLERDVLGCLAEGRSVRETARVLNRSHTWVAKKRQWIAGIVKHLESGGAVVHGVALVPAKDSDETARASPVNRRQEADFQA
jgi:hypothetical protein